MFYHHEILIYSFYVGYDIYNNHPPTHPSNPPLPTYITVKTRTIRPHVSHPKTPSFVSREERHSEKEKRTTLHPSTKANKRKFTPSPIDNTRKSLQLQRPASGPINQYSSSVFIISYNTARGALYTVQVDQAHPII